jgi:oligopeptide/dipeptide ABC transporter ATP-binding protein
MTGAVSNLEDARTTPGSDQPIVEVENLVIRMKSAHPFTLVDGVSFSLLPGRALALVGESGAGKSITCRAILNLLNPRKFDVSGTVRLGGVEVSALRAKAWRAQATRTSSLIFQDPTRSLNPTMKVGWQIAEAMYKSTSRREKLSKSAAKERAVNLMREVGIADPEERFYTYPHQLSGGMRQRIVIAIALSCDPQVIFADEPTTSLDVTTQAQIMDLLDDLRQKRQIAVVLVTHDLALAASRVDEAMVMYAGRLVEKLPSSDVARSAQMPYSHALLNAVPGMEIDGEIPDPIPGAPPNPRALPPGCAFEPRCSYRGQICIDERPELKELSPGHECACWFPIDLDAMRLSEAKR